MLSFHKKNELPIKKWRSKARLIDLRKTRLTIINTKTPDLPDTTRNSGNVDDLETAMANIGASNAEEDFAGNAETLIESSSTPISFVLVED
jgi:hypothetical protein